MMPKGTRTVNAATRRAESTATCRVEFIRPRRWTGPLRANEFAPTTSSGARRAEFIRPRRVSLRCVRMNSHLRQLRGAVAGNPDHSEWLQPWHFGPAALDRVRAARMKGAARRRIERRRQLTLERDALPPRPRVERRRAREQRPRVRMRRPAEHGVLRAVFDDLAQVHHRHRIGDMTHDLKIMGNEEICDAELFLQIHEE